MHFISICYHVTLSCPASGSALLLYLVLFHILSKQQNRRYMFKIDNNTINCCSINAMGDIMIFVSFIPPQSFKYCVMVTIKTKSGVKLSIPLLKRCTKRVNIGKTAVSCTEGLQIYDVKLFKTRINISVICFVLFGFKHYLIFVT